MAMCMAYISEEHAKQVKCGMMLVHPTLCKILPHEKQAEYVHSTLVVVKTMP